MNSNRWSYGVVILLALCLTGLISQCTHSIQECKLEGIKSGKPAEEITKICRT